MDEQQAASHRFDTHINFVPEKADILKLSQAVVDFLGVHGEASPFLHIALSDHP